MGNTGPTVRVEVGDTPVALVDELAANNGRLLGMLITVEGNAVRVAMGGAVPGQGSGGLGHEIDPGTPFRPTGQGNVGVVQAVAAEAGHVAVLHITPEYA